MALATVPRASELRVRVARAARRTLEGRMTMTLGFDSFGYLEALFDADVARDIFVALAKHAPGGFLRLARRTRGAYGVTEIDGAGNETACDEGAAISAAITKASYVDWANEDAPLGAPPLLLPGKGWNLKALTKQPVFESEAVKFHFATEEIAKAREYFDAPCAELFDLAERQMLVLAYR